MQNLFDKFNASKKNLENLLRANNGIPGDIRYWMDADAENKFLSRQNQESVSYWKNKKIEYRFNNYGFRTDDDFILENEGLVTLGCSFTQGIGLPIEATWGYKLAQYFNLKHYNLGQAGKGLQTAYRLLLGYHDILKFKKVFLFIPPQYRDEFIIEDNELLKGFLTGVDKNKNFINTLGSVLHQHIFFGLEDSSHDQLMKAWIFGSKKNNIVNYIRTLSAIKGLCEFIGAELYFLSFDEFNTKEKFEEAYNIPDSVCANIPARDDHWSAKRQHLIYQYFLDLYENNNR